MSDQAEETTLLYSINDVHAFRLSSQKEASLTPSGPQTLSLATPVSPRNEARNEDKVTLLIQLSTDVDLPLKKSTKIFFRPPRSYMIPPASFENNVATFTRIELPETVEQEDIDTFETILTQCTSFRPRSQLPQTPNRSGTSTPARRSSDTPLSRITSPTSRAPQTPVARTDSLPRRPFETPLSKTTSPNQRPFDSPLSRTNTPTSSLTPAQSRPGVDRKATGQLVLVDEDDGTVMGELGAGAEVIEHSKVGKGSQDTPVEISISEDGTRVDVREASEDYLRAARDPAYADSAFVQNAAKASRLIVTSSTRFGNMISSSAERYTQKTAPTSKPVHFSPAAQETAKKVHSVTKTGAQFTARQVERLANYTQNLVASMVETEGDKDPNQEPAMPGWVKEGFVGLSTVLDGIAEGTKTVMSESSTAATMAVGHKFGPDAGQMAASLGGGLRNVGLVYVGVTGIPRRAVITSVAKGMIVGTVKDKDGNEQEVIVGAGDGGMVDGKMIEPVDEEKMIAAIADGRYKPNNNDDDDSSDDDFIRKARKFSMK